MTYTEWHIKSEECYREHEIQMAALEIARRALEREYHTKLDDLWEIYKKEVRSESNS